MTQPLWPNNPCDRVAREAAGERSGESAAQRDEEPPNEVGSNQLKGKDMSISLCLFINAEYDYEIRWRGKDGDERNS